jgi:small subunit ribosomal protein S11
MAIVKQQQQRKKAKVVVSSGKAYVQASFNNTLVYITDLEGNTLSWATAGGMGFKGSRKSTPYAAQQAATKAGQAAKDNFSMRSIDIYIKGPGPGREAAARALSNCFDKVTSIYDVTGIPHNGCRAEKERRV